MPVACFNVLNGGKHSGNNVSCQEIMIAFPNMSFHKQVKTAANLYSSLKRLIVKRHGAIYTGVGKEGGFMPPISSVEEGINMVLEAAKTLELRPGKLGNDIKEPGKISEGTDKCQGRPGDTNKCRPEGSNKCKGRSRDSSNRDPGKISENEFKIFLDFAANSFYKNGIYKMDGRSYRTEELCRYYLNLVKTYPMIMGIEDPFEENDLSGWRSLYREVGGSINIIADDLTVTNSKLIRKYAEEAVLQGEEPMFNVVLIKPTQIGTVTGVIEAVNAASKGNCCTMMSHRSSETEDTVLCSLAVGMEAKFIKCGAPCRERAFKYNELLRIEEELESEREQLIDEVFSDDNIL